ncbi:F-box domain-containing protein [Apiospora sp. TS-2023a]
MNAEAAPGAPGEAPIAGVATDGISTRQPAQVSHLVRLPKELQKEIFSHCSQCDLICLSLVCKSFRELAAAQLYRNFHIVFPDEDDPSFDSPIDGLAGGLDTFVTSEYNYAQHLRDISLDTLSAGDKAETAYKPYLFGVSCGKFMNSLLLLTLRKATSLDSFRWNIRVELTAAAIALLFLCVNHGACADYGTPPPPPMPVVPSIELITGGTPISNLFGPGTVAWGPPPVPIATASHAPVAKHSLKAKPSRKQHSTEKKPPTIGGFKRLESLGVLDIDSLDMVTEIKNCIENSSSTLKKLKLSFSDALATQARKPCLVDPNDSDEDDDFQVVPMSSGYDDGSGPAKAFRAQEERKVQESVLGRIFDIEPFVPKKPLVNKEKRPDIKLTNRDASQRFINSMTNVTKRLMMGVDGSRVLTSQRQECLDLMIEAAKKYVAFREDLVTDGATGDGAGPNASGLNGHAADSDNDDAETVAEAALSSVPKVQTDQDETRPEDIDVAAPEEQLVEQQDDVASDVASKAETTQMDTSSGEPASSCQSDSTLPLEDIPTEVLDTLQVGLNSHPGDTQDLQLLQADVAPDSDDTLANSSLQEMAEKLKALEISDKEHDMNILEAELEDAGDSHDAHTVDDKEDLRRQISAYIRGTRGVALKSLSLHLIPTKASVLGRAIDLHTLRKLTLLNVGNQAPIWSLLAKENKLAPLPLVKIFTDHVSLPFLHFVSQLEQVDELFMIERSTKNDADDTWDADEKTTQLICRKGKALEELAVIMGIKSVHTFLQHLSGLINLRALHIISFRSDDTCLSVMRETRRFIVDTISHYPELKLEWLSIGDDDRAERIMRRTDLPNAKKKKKKDKGKDVASDLLANMGTEDGYPAFPDDDRWDEESDSDEDEGNPPHWLKLDLIDGIAFYDVWGVKIFQKEIMAARL